MRAHHVIKIIAAVNDVDDGCFIFLLLVPPFFVASASLDSFKRILNSFSRGCSVSSSYVFVCYSPFFYEKVSLCFSVVFLLF